MTTLTTVLRSWSEVFMRRSMHDFMRFSRQSGLSMTQISVLFRLHYGGSCGVSDLGEHLGVSNAAASQMVDRLVGMELLKRSEDPADRRVKTLALTPKGEALVLDSIEARRRWMEDLTTALAPDQEQQIAAALTTLTQAALKLEDGQALEPLSRSKSIHP
jgi:DNA-binding MarR family transcriptional regulator